MFLPKVVLCVLLTEQQKHLEKFRRIRSLVFYSDLVFFASRHVRRRGQRNELGSGGEGFIPCQPEESISLAFCF